MSLQIGSAVGGAVDRLVSRTGGALLVSYSVLVIAIQVSMNTAIAQLYRQMGFTEAATLLPLALDIPLGVAVGSIFVAMLLSTYLSVVGVRTFVADAQESFPAGALTRNVPLAVLNVLVGGVVYGLAVFVGSLLLLVPGIFLYVVLIFMVPYIAVEDRNFVTALRESYRLSEGNRVALFALLVLVVAVSGVFGGIVGAGAFLLSPSLSQLLITLVQAPTSLFSLAVISVAYSQLREGESDSGVTPGPSEDTGATTAL
ncbi:hypothetical protein [Haloarcula montana]|uniref:hypothetical protein n=1 Tax=Haloarcula montana TaxID=3111776 RepID=UPI002D773BC8|nr:hypothetical protein [Haloarcula sp. GH36]